MGESAHDSSAREVMRVALTLEARLEARPVAIALVMALACQVPGADQDFRDEMTTAFGEAFNNIVIHGYKGRQGGMLDIEAELGQEQLTLRLKDSGREIDFESVSPPDFASMPESGMGLFMIHALVDEVQYRKGTPNVLSLTKRIAATGDAR